jgi:tocopherol O-methyltransferase
MPTTQEISNYYTFSKLDYQLYNLSRSSISMHFGMWDESVKNHKQALLNENKVLTDIAKITDKDSVVDFGCGYGMSAVWLALHYGCQVTGITLGLDQVECATQLAKKWGIAHKVTFQTADFHKTPFPNEFFTVVFSIESISHSETKPVVLKEAYRLLKPGGRLVIADGFFAKDPNTLTHEESIIAKKCFEGVHVPPVAKKSDFEQWIKDAGFKNVLFFDKTQAILPTAKKCHRFGKILYPFSKLLRPFHVKALQPSHMEAFINQYYAWRDGIGVYGIFYAEK